MIIIMCASRFAGSMRKARSNLCNGDAEEMRKTGIKRDKGKVQP